MVRFLLSVPAGQSWKESIAALLDFCVYLSIRVFWNELRPFMTVPVYSSGWDWLLGTAKSPGWALRVTLGKFNWYSDNFQDQLVPVIGREQHAARREKKEKSGPIEVDHLYWLFGFLPFFIEDIVPMRNRKSPSWSSSPVRRKGQQLYLENELAFADLTRGSQRILTHFKRFCGVWNWWCTSCMSHWPLATLNHPQHQHYSSHTRWYKWISAVL